jgi:hypothetical protein
MFIKAFANLIFYSRFAYKKKIKRLLRLIIINFIPLNYIIAVLINKFSSKNKYLLYKIINNFNLIGKGYIRYISTKTRKSIFFSIRKNNQIIKNKFADEVLRNGYCKLKYKLSQKKIIFFFNEIKNKNFYNSQVPSQSSALINYNYVFNSKEGGNFYCLHPEISLNSKILKKIIYGKKLKEIADSYCGYKTELYSINTFLSKPSNNNIPHYVQRLHRDYDDVSSLTFFICWTKTSINDGATLFHKKSHFEDEEKKIISLSGSPGEIYCVDTFGLHSGNLNLKKIRLSTWIRYGRRNCYASLTDSNDYLKSYKEINKNKENFT